MNTRGLSGTTKRRSVFNYYRQKCDILCLQETHCVAKNQNVWLNEWGGQGVFSNGQSNARGVCILINKRAGVKIINSQHDVNGRIVSALLQKESYEFKLVNIYAPNVDEPGFFVEVEQHCVPHFEKLIVVGDFNLVMNPKLDQNNPNRNNHNKSLEKVVSMCDELMLEDIWQNINEGVSRYTWHRIERGGRVSASRLDFFLISRGLCYSVGQCTYITGIHTDHSAAYMFFNPISTERGVGYWKFNTSLLEDHDYLSFMNSYLDDFMRINGSLELKRKWELLKFEIGSQTREFSRGKISTNELIISQLSEKVVELEDSLGELNKEDMQKTVQILEDTKLDLNDKLDDKIKGVIFRTKATWQDLAEKSSKYFYSLGKGEIQC